MDYIDDILTVVRSCTRGHRLRIHNKDMLVKTRLRFRSSTGEQVTNFLVRFFQRLTIVKLPIRMLYYLEDVSSSLACLCITYGLNMKTWPVLSIWTTVQKMYMNEPRLILPVSISVEPEIIHSLKIIATVERHTDTVISKYVSDIEKWFLFIFQYMSCHSWSNQLKTLVKTIHTLVIYGIDIIFHRFYKNVEKNRCLIYKTIWLRLHDEQITDEVPILPRRSSMNLYTISL